MDYEIVIEDKFIVTSSGIIEHRMAENHIDL